MGVESMTALQWIQILLLGAMAGGMGQGIRVAVGIKKMQDEAAAKGEDGSLQFRWSRLSTSVLIGMIAGALAALGVPPDPAKVDINQLLAYMAAGYAGADFIEGFAKRRLAALTPPAAESDKPQRSASATSLRSEDDYLG